MMRADALLATCMGLAAFVGLTSASCSKKPTPVCTTCQDTATTGLVTVVSTGGDGAQIVLDGAMTGAVTPHTFVLDTLLTHTFEV